MTGLGEDVKMKPSEDCRARVAIDLGAESCRVTLLRWLHGKPTIRLLKRIPNAPYTDVDGNLRWPLHRLTQQIFDALKLAAAETPEGISSIGVDGWAVDSVRLNEQGQAVEDPFCYRDERTITVKESLDSTLAPSELFARTGVQPLRINTVYQLAADGLHRSAKRRWLLLPEFFLHTLGAEPVAEWTNATHTGLVDATTRQWDPEVFARAGLDLALAPRIVAPGTVIGKVRGELAQLDAFRQTRLIAPACHDTASAVATMQSDPNDCAYIICGTWSLVGSALSKPVMTETVRQRGFTNLGAAGGTYCFHTNINGMWMLKQCVEQWLAEGRASERLEFNHLTQQAEHAEVPDEAIFPVDAAELLLPGEMPQKIRRLLREHTGITLAENGNDEAAITRVILNSLAFRYAQTMRDLEELTGRRYGQIRVLGGGARNLLLLQFIAESTGRTVTAGSVEASTLGNFALQMAADHSDNPQLRLLRPCVEICAQAEWLPS